MPYEQQQRDRTGLLIPHVCNNRFHCSAASMDQDQFSSSVRTEGHMQWKKMAANKLWTGAWSVPKASRHDTKQSPGSRTRTTQGGFKSYMSHIRVQTENSFWCG